VLTEIINLSIGALVNLLVALTVVAGIYYPSTRNKSMVFSFVAFNTVTYFVIGLLTSVELSIGVGFGLFAIFSVLRYRTAEIPIREMTYLFVVIALPVVNAILIPREAIAQLLVANIFVIVVMWVMEKGWGFNFEQQKTVHYERVDLIAPVYYEQLLADLRQRTGLPIKRVEVGEIDFVRDMAELTIYYDAPKRSSRTAPTSQQELPKAKQPKLES
jgi:hypothetical protein